jgi:hypothetical protein
LEAGQGILAIAFASGLLPFLFDFCSKKRSKREQMKSGQVKEI